MMASQRVSLAKRESLLSDLYFKIFTARAITSPTVTSEVKDCIIINIFAQRLRGAVSVGLNALAFVTEIYK